MSASLAADLVVLLHFAFILFAVFGALLLLRWPRLAWLHLPALAWAAGIMMVGGVCPLTPLEQRLRAQAGQAGYEGGFIEHYIMPLIYPPGLTREAQLAGAALLLAANSAVYALWLRRRRQLRLRSSS
jgi:hypothetical protein